jgi:hypothetical protein
MIPKYDTLVQSSRQDLIPKSRQVKLKATILQWPSPLLPDITILKIKS